MSEDLTDEERVRRRHSTREDFHNIQGDLVCTECEDVWPCTEIRALDILQARITELEEEQDCLIATSSDQSKSPGTHLA
jgi:hypothetical protein